MTAQTIMTSQPVVLKETDTVGTAVESILSHHLRHMPVVDHDGRYVGIFGIYSLLRLTLPKALTLEQGLESVPFFQAGLEELREHLHEQWNSSVVSCLRQDIPVLHPDTSLLDTVLTLLRARIALPVVDKTTGRLEGMISSWSALEKIVGEKA
ncbi:MAG: CBS domain-containing protein [Gammaproteobacteria bacterium]|nr:CBS domain-containing protein [Gammaproteobacteria bacterium]MCP5423978.1 CBS domain-containing protein [Gammaproteobacteria bacterium]MCP5459457.1 CBS domain-containing protein [Gammaproteobacteria bacterium]